MTATFRPTSLDHVALWVDERGSLAGFLCDQLGMHVIEETDSFTLVGVDAKLGKLTLFDAEAPRERGALERIALRVADVEAAAASLPVNVARGRAGMAVFEGPGGVPLGLVEGPGPEYDLDHVVLGLADPEAATTELTRFGFERRDGVATVADRHVRIERGLREDGGRPLLNHLALLVDDAHAVQERAAAEGLVIDDVKDAPNTFAVFLRGPEGVRIEYVEHKPGFALI
jgi:catechol 2,3-dioxygenase-like lactoylglutathione lyase family enzyme